MDAPEKVARQRLSVLELAEQLGNAAEAMSRTGHASLVAAVSEPIAEGLDRE